MVGATVSSMGSSYLRGLHRRGGFDPGLEKWVRFCQEEARRVSRGREESLGLQGTACERDESMQNILLIIVRS